MKISSRWMPDLDGKPIGWMGLSTFYVTLFGGLLALVIYWRPMVFILPAFVLVLCLLGRDDSSPAVKARMSETICDFARSFDCRDIDTWIIRAVFEEFSDRHPIRSTDSFEDDLCIYDEDLEDSIVSIANRIGRSLDDVEGNPFYGRIHTVYDLVMFFQEQPLSQGVRHNR